ncbi:CACTA en-spm transposon protein [Cucumis melo var. makuwa]|uniref:CACTA en-spm transposon protein n=1 Tax=Cucumis melo var. makuwa TaxID=1194695 RepID=A0A5A7T5D6_CUCMM|nr:CACTA en-spm transposon protein [Cucumis melo var. makuwa]
MKRRKKRLMSVGNSPLKSFQFCILQNRNREVKRKEKPRLSSRFPSPFCRCSAAVCRRPPSPLSLAAVCHFSYGSFFVLNLFMFEMTILQLCYGSLCSFEGFVGCEDIFKYFVGNKFLQRQYELAERRGQPVNRVELFRETHVRVGTFVSQAAEDAHNQMLELQSQPTPEGSQPLSEDEICDQVLGRRPSYSKGLGWGPKPKARRTASASSLSTSCSQSTEKEIELQAKLHEALERIEVQDRNHQALASQVEAMKKMIEELTRAQQGPPHDP